MHSHCNNSNTEIWRATYSFYNIFPIPFFSELKTVITLRCSFARILSLCILHMYIFRIEKYSLLWAWPIATSGIVPYALLFKFFFYNKFQRSFPTWTIQIQLIISNCYSIFTSKQRHAKETMTECSFKRHVSREKTDSIWWEIGCLSDCICLSDVLIHVS